MHPRQQIAIIGSGASAIYFLKHLLDKAGILHHHIGEISIFEQGDITGMGMPYSPKTTDRYNMSNISSEELPELPITFGDWLREQDPSYLMELGVEDLEISDSEVYSRLSLGRYLNDQYKTIIARLAGKSIVIREFPNCRINDVHDIAAEDKVELCTQQGKLLRFDRVIIATGHVWPGADKPENGLFASPWPISKLLPEEGKYHDFSIGTLGASLSAFDVIASIAHRHGEFVEDSGGLVFHPFPGTENFIITMHSSHGLLPHLQFDQVEPLREIYRHIDREGLLALVNADGFLRIESYFDKVCRPALTIAFGKDALPSIVDLLADPQFGLIDFVVKMTDEHEYPDAFEGMRFEMVEAKKSVLQHRPIHWKEVLDDLIYTLNFHAELMPAEDHLILRSHVMPFLLNVMAAMPLNSGNMILALYDAGKLGLIAGKVNINEHSEQDGGTTITVEDDDKTSTIDYSMFVDCSGQKRLNSTNIHLRDLLKTARHVAPAPVFVNQN